MLHNLGATDSKADSPFVSSEEPPTAAEYQTGWRQEVTIKRSEHAEGVSLSIQYKTFLRLAPTLSEETSER